eukprot:7694859-Alexandrium_andersonii.AAC.1
MSASLVGSEMCIRDRALAHPSTRSSWASCGPASARTWGENFETSLLYTADAADDMQCVDLGGR